jgi:hypothetical protein
VPFAAQYKIPATYSGRRFALEGGLMSYSRDPANEIRIATFVIFYSFTEPPIITLFRYHAEIRICSNKSKPT